MTIPQTYNILEKPTHLGAQASQADLAALYVAKAIWNEKNAQALGLMQATISPVIWQDFVSYGKVKELWDTLETHFRKGGGGTTHCTISTPSSQMHNIGL